jgi:signal transduction histidine kinase
MAAEDILVVDHETPSRQWITELHDGAVQSLALARIQLTSIIKQFTDPLRAAKLDDVSRLLKQCLQEIRNVLSDLSSPTLQKMGLSVAISEWLEEQAGRRYGLRTSFTDDSDRTPLRDDVRALLFRSIRELLMNTIKHAKAEMISVRLTSSEEELRITV